MNNQLQQSKKEDRLWLKGIKVHLYQDNKTLIVSSSGRTYLIDADPETVSSMLEAFDGSNTIAEVLGKGPNPEAFLEVIEILHQDGCLTSSDNQSTKSNIHAIMLGNSDLIHMAHELKLLQHFTTTELYDAGDLKATIEQRKLSDQEVIVIVLNTTFDYQLLTKINDICDAYKVGWTQLHLEHNKGWLGPSIIPGSTPDYRDLLGRRLAAVEFADIFHALTSPSIYSKLDLPSRNEITWMLAFFLNDIKQWVEKKEAQTVGNEVEIDAGTATVTLHPILPLPHRKLDGEHPINYYKQGKDLLFDDRTGLITHLQLIEHDVSIPPSLTTIQSHVADMRRIYVWANNTVCSGSTFGNHTASKNAAIGEGIERYCGNWVQTAKIISSSYEELCARGEYAVDPEKLILYSDTQYDTPGFPFERFTRNLEVHWVRGWSLTGNRPAWIPASLVYVNWYLGDYANDPFTNFLYYPGIAAGQSLEHAIAAGLEEVIERHVTMVWWTNRQPLPALKLPPELSALWEGMPYEKGQRAWLIHLDNEFNVPVMAAVVENLHEKLFNIGFDAHNDPIQAAYKAWTEALTLQEGSRDLLLEKGLYRQAIIDGKLTTQVKPWRADRAYLEDYRSDFKDANGLMCQQQVFLDPRAREYVRSWVDVEATRNMDELPRLKDRSSASFRSVVEAQGYEVFYIDVTTPDIEYTGLKAVRVVVPGMVPNFPAAFPFLGQAKIQNLAVQLGWRSEPLAEEDLNYFPMPHA